MWEKGNPIHSYNCWRMKSMSTRLLRSLWLGVAVSQLAGVGCAAAAVAPFAQAASGSATAPADLASLQKQALEEGETGKTDDAIRDYERALQLEPGWKEGLWNLGMLQYSSNRFAEAKGTFQKVAEFAPSLGIAWSLLGLSEYETGEYDDALSHLEKAQSLGIQDDDIARVSSYHLGLLRTRAGDFDRASELLLANFGTGIVSPQAKIALGLAMLRVPLLPEQLDPSREAMVLAAGSAAASGIDGLTRFPALLQAYPEIPYLHLAYALALAKAGRDKEARPQILEETKISPDSPLVWLELSRIEQRLGMTKESLQAAQKSVQLSPGNKDAHEVLAQALEAAGNAQQAADERKLATAAPAGPATAKRRIVLLYANEAAKAGTEASQEHWTRALREYVAGQYAAAGADLKAWLAVTPDSGTGWALLGLCEFALKDFDNALIHLDRSAKLGMSASPESLHQARYTFGILLIHAGQFDQAQEVLASAANAAAPLAAKVEFAQGLALLRRAEFPEDASPDEAPLVTAAGRIAALVEQSKYDDAFPQFKQLLEKYPSAPFLHYAYGTALIALSDFDQAAEQMKAELAISPASELPCLRLASIALRRHDAATALTWSQHALQLAPNSVDAHYLLGRAALETGDVPTSVRELEVAVKLSPASPEIHFNLAKAYARAKMPDKAQQERETFTRLNEAAQSHSQGSQMPAGSRNAGGPATAPAQSPASPPNH
jgi:tetratricopeptide (TPR) repeat protein